MNIRHNLLLVLAVSLLTATGARADKLDDYKRAREQRYCESIPDSDRQSDCRAAQANVKSYCDEISCDGLSFKDNANRANRLKEEITRLESEIRDLDSKISSAKDDDKKRFEYDRDGKRRDIEGKKRDLEPLEKQINDTRIQIQGRIEKGNRCRNSRLEVQRIFLRAENDADSDGKSNEEIKKIADELIPEWKKEGVKHADAIIGTQNSLDRCNERVEGKN